MSEPATDDVEVKGQKLLSSPASYYAQLLPKLREIAASHGYALAVHGSLTRDCDLVAVPWQEWATDSLTLVKAIKAETGGFFHSPDSAWERLVENGAPTAKPHGRLSYSIHLTERGMDGPYLDVSVMPRATIPARDGSGSNASSLPETEKVLVEKDGGIVHVTERLMSNVNAEQPPPRHSSSFAAGRKSDFCPRRETKSENGSG